MPNPTPCPVPAKDIFGNCFRCGRRWEEHGSGVVADALADVRSAIQGLESDAETAHRLSDVLDSLRDAARVLEREVGNDGTRRPVGLSDRAWEQLQSLSKESGRSVADLIRTARLP